MSAKDELVTSVHRALRQRHPKDAWVYLAEVRTRTGYSDFGHWSTFDGVRLIDAFAIGCWKSLDYRRIAYEIKVDRGDWLRELKDPRKRAQAYFLSHEFWFAVTPGVIHHTPGPDNDLAKFGKDIDGCGVLEVQEDGSIKVIERAARRAAWPMPEPFVASLLRHSMGVFASERERAEESERAKPRAPRPASLFDSLEEPA